VPRPCAAFRARVRSTIPQQLSSKRSALANFALSLAAKTKTRLGWGIPVRGGWRREKQTQVRTLFIRHGGFRSLRVTGLKAVPGLRPLRHPDEHKSLAGAPATAGLPWAIFLPSLRDGAPGDPRYPTLSVRWRDPKGWGNRLRTGAGRAVWEHRSPKAGDRGHPAIFLPSFRDGVDPLLVP
jgi:hypothetical protein